MFVASRSCELASPHCTPAKTDSTGSIRGGDGVGDSVAVVCVSDSPLEFRVDGGPLVGSDEGFR
jgi:hypothetical protein